MEIPKIEHVDTECAAAVAGAFAGVEPQAIACCNWPDRFPYVPKVVFRMFHTGDRLLVRFDVEERWTAALVDEDNGRVCSDSCVELFISPDDTYYYNFESNPIGRLLLGFHRSRAEGRRAGADTLAMVRRMPSLPPEPFAEREGDNRWNTTLVIPPQALFGHALASWSGLEARMNLYKCGDALSQPHYLSWKPVGTENPDFHRPEFFEKVKFSL